MTHKILFFLIVAGCTGMLALHGAKGAQDKFEGGISKPCAGKACKPLPENTVFLCLKGPE